MIMLGAGLFVLGLALGALAAWLVASGKLRSAESRAAAAESTNASLREQLAKEQAETRSLREKLEFEQKARTAAETSFAAERKNLEEQRGLLEDAKTKLSDAFKALSSDVLGAQSKVFLQLAEQSFGTLRAEAAGDLDQRREAINGLIKPLKDTVDRLTSETHSLGSSSQELQRQTGSLATALRGLPQVRGRWGELSLERAAELAGMVEYCDFIKQPTGEGEEGRLRPDMIVRLPAGRQVVVDAKVPLLAYYEAAEAKTDEERNAALKRHAQSVRDHLGRLALKRYSDQFQPSPDFVICFFPHEGFLGAGALYDLTLVEDSMAKGVIPATPTTLIALLLAVERGWKEAEFTQHAQQVQELASTLYERFLTLWTHLCDLRAGIENATAAWNKFVGSLEIRLIPSLRRFHELGAPSAEELPPLEPLDQATRGLPAPPDSDSK